MRLHKSKNLIVGLKKGIDVTFRHPVPDYIFRETFDSYDRLQGVPINITATNIAAGRVGNAITLNGVDEYIRHTDDVTRGDIGTTDFTISALVKKGDANSDCIAGKCNDDTATGGPGYIFYVTNNRLRLRYADLNVTADYLSPTTVNFADGNWHHVLVTVTRATGAIAFYADGAAYGTPTGANTYNLSNSKPMTVGVFYNVGFYNSALFTGSIDELLIYNRKLTATEIALLAGM